MMPWEILVPSIITGCLVFFTWLGRLAQTALDTQKKVTSTQAAQGVSITELMRELQSNATVIKEMSETIRVLQDTEKLNSSTITTLTEQVQDLTRQVKELTDDKIRLSDLLINAQTTVTNLQNADKRAMIAEAEKTVALNIHREYKDLLSEAVTNYNDLLKELLKREPVPIVLTVPEPNKTKSNEEQQNDS